MNDRYFCHAHQISILNHLLHPAGLVPASRVRRHPSHTWIQGLLGHPGRFQQDPNSVTSPETLLPRKVTCTGSRGQDVDIFRGTIIQPTAVATERSLPISWLYCELREAPGGGGLVETGALGTELTGVAFPSAAGAQNPPQTHTHPLTHLEFLPSTPTLSLSAAPPPGHLC